MPSLSRIFRKVIEICAYALSGVLICLVVAAVWYLESRPDLEIWHTADLDMEFTVERRDDPAGPVNTFEAYQALEQQLFDQLDQLVIRASESAPQSRINRFHRNSLASPGRWPQNWNRSFELPADSAKAGVLLLHGMSDSPYSLRALAQQVNQLGAWALALRVPGHGTAPSGLAKTTWQDMSAAVQIAAEHLRNKIGNAPLYIVGYSNGGALALEYALRALDDHNLPKASGLVLISPQVGLTPLAAFAVLQEKLGHLLVLEKLAWNAILLEYDPFKYGSFALNAAIQAWELTSRNQKTIQHKASTGGLAELPPILAFQSTVDATISAPALVDSLFSHLGSSQPHEMVLFDINRETEVENILSKDPGGWFNPLLEQQSLEFAVSLVANEDEDTRAVVVRYKAAGQSNMVPCKLDMQWPDDVYSLSHVALAIAEDDSLYGSGEALSPGLKLGDLILRGERDTLRISASEILRQRWNPFYDYLSARAHTFMGLLTPSDGICDPGK